MCVLVCNRVFVFYFLPSKSTSSLSIFHFSDMDHFGSSLAEGGMKGGGRTVG